MAFPNGFLDEIRARLSLSEVIGRRLRLIRAGREWKAPCPFHNEKTPSFYVNDQKQFFHCFGCGAHGDVIGFSMRHDNLSFPEAVEQLAALAGLEVPRQSPQELQRFERQKTLYDVLESATTWFERQLRTPAGANALAYLKGRGLDDETIQQFRLGYAPADAQLLGAAMAAEGHDPEELLELELTRRPDDGRAPYSFFRNRVLFPVSDRRGRMIAFGGRILDGDGPKYINSPEHPLFQKGQVLYGLSRARGIADAVPVVVEGYMDVIALNRAGYGGAVAPLGTALTEAQLAELWRLDPTGNRAPVLCFDGDNAGQRAAERAIARILPLVTASRTVRVAFLPAGDDPDSLIRTGGKPAMDRTLEAALPLIDAVWQLTVAGQPTETPEQRARLREMALAKVEVIADRSCQMYYRDEVRARLDQAMPRRGFGGPKGKGDWGKGGAGGGKAIGIKPRATRQRRANRGVDDRTERLLLAAVVAHPEFWPELSHQLGEVVFPGVEMERLRLAVVELLDEPLGLDASTVCIHLGARGLADTAASLLEFAAGLAPRVVHQDAEEARAEVHELLRLAHHHAMGVEVRAAVSAPGSGADPALDRLVAMALEKAGLIEGDDGESDTPRG